jgi:hypothetical protein
MPELMPNGKNSTIIQGRLVPSGIHPGGSLPGKAGADVIRLPEGDGLTSILHTHDALIVTPGVSSAPTRRAARRIEPKVTGPSRIPGFPLLENHACLIEGVILWIDRHTLSLASLPHQSKASASRKLAGPDVRFSFDMPHYKAGPMSLSQSASVHLMI